MMRARGLRRGTPAARRARALLALAAACMAMHPASAQSDAPAPPPIPALDIDPTEKIDVRGWWSNGRELLLIQADGGYKLWKGTNRFLAPDDIGRWDRQTYRTLWLETYRSQKHTRDRAHLRREGGTLLLTMRDLQPMQPLARPPHTREDSLVGAWSGPPGTLTLRDDGTYSFSVAKSGPKDRQPARIGSHSGTWLVRDETVVLSQGDRMKPVVATIVTPVPAPSGATSPGAPAPGRGATPQGAPAASPAPAAGSPAAPPLPHQLMAPEGTTIVMPGGELRREVPAELPGR
ncbi:MAG: hypothetical protein FGM37_03470 [Phycisphaerales bacterium]|nr:hypothetical protein [Phycisphaerales bacterium]